MTLQAKLGIAALTIGSGGVATYAALVPKVRGTEINKLIEKEFRYILLDTNEGSDNKDDEQWGKRWESYKKDNKQNTFGLDNWDKKDSQDLRDQLRKKCKKLAKEEVQKTTDDLYKNVTKYCARDVTIQDHAKKDNLSLIKTDTSTTEPWNKVANKKDKLTAHFKNLEITASLDASYTGDNVKKGCVAATKKHKGEDKYDEIYNSYKSVCITKASEDQ